ncbi:MAG TPA: OmpA family protein [Gemmatimonadaceae bacterium]|nr:OmpA family protein [Gemmatimonadaceae bacterium]
MKEQVKMLATVALVAPIMAGCASKGFVRKNVAQSLADQKAQITSQLGAQIDSSVGAERVARMAGDSTIMANVSNLRRDLDSLRTEFGAKITALQTGMQFDIPVTFAFDDATVPDQEKPALDQFARVANKYYPGSTITVEGFADPAGSRAYNRRLSERRASSVKDYLTGQGGLSADQIQTVGYGESRQVVKGAEGSQPGAEKNRRVVFVIETAPEGAAGATTALP